LMTYMKGTKSMSKRRLWKNLVQLTMELLVGLKVKRYAKWNRLSLFLFLFLVF
jgi:hypothetical protein